ncbi:carbohydrate-binding protein [Actinoplanes aureus]|uniref:Carbohydrate-binding protein n=1 Tax=Actinoplanes aureus TaxID=2792083 RepID=A0A931C8L7_9ACTN|nr:carbohydrate-binding protein [Actinoplanes aureus]MBG0560350.1 carbohydrate-binding protein [Actinoplanes aureus]
MDQRSPTVYRTRSWTNRRRALTGLGGVGLVLLGYLIGRWQDTPAAISAPPAVAASSSAAAPAPSTEAPSPSPSPKPVDYPVLQAESATELAGIEAEDTQDEGGGKNVGWITRHDHLRFDNFDFGEVPAVKAKVRMSSQAGVSGRVQFRLDSRDAPPVGEVTVINTGGWQNWQTVAAVLEPVTGVHTVFVTFTTTDDSEFVNLNWLQFEH